MKFLVSIALVFSVSVARAEAPKQEEMPAGDVTKWLAFFDKLVSTVVADEKDCNKMANDVSTVIDQHRVALELAAKAREARKKLPQHAQDRMLAGVKKMAPGIQNCGEKENVKLAFGKLDLSRGQARRSPAPSR